MRNTNSTTATPGPQTPAETHTFAAIDHLAIVLGASMMQDVPEQKRQIREALRELWRALEALPQVA